MSEQISECFTIGCRKLVHLSLKSVRFLLFRWRFYSREMALIYHKTSRKKTLNKPNLASVTDNSIKLTFPYGKYHSLFQSIEVYSQKKSRNLSLGIIRA